MRIVVPVVASYPDRRECLRNASVCRKQGFTVVLDPAILKKGLDKKWDDQSDPKDRATTLISLMSLDKNDLLVPATGGMGTIRTLSAAPWFKGAWVRNKVAVGFSDATAFAVKVAAYSKYPSFHGPCFEDKEFIEALPYYLLKKTSWTIPCTFVDGDLSSPTSFRAPIWGGNLTLFGYMMSDLDVRQRVNSQPKILFFEDIFDPAIYRNADTTELLEMEFDRLEYCGLFKNVKVILLGRITGKKRVTVMQSLRHYYSGIVIGVDIGHKEKHKGWAFLPPIPLGIEVNLSYHSMRALTCTWGRKR